MSDDNNKALKIILDSINTIVKNAIKSAPFDKTEEGRIISSLGDNKYTVSINGTEYNIKAHGSSAYSVNDIVRIVVPKNDYKKMFIL